MAVTPRDSGVQNALNAGLINPFGPQSAADQAAINSMLVYAQTITSKGDVDFIDARVSKDIFQLPAGPLSLGLGAEFRKEKYTYVAEDITAELPSSLGIDPDSDVTGKRDVTALFAEFAIPIVKNLDMQVAFRYDHYSDFGNTFNPKVGVRYQPTPELLLRASYNSGFRAPTLFEIYQPASLTFTSDNYDDPLLCPGGVAVPGASDGVVCAPAGASSSFQGRPRSDFRSPHCSRKSPTRGGSASCSSRMPVSRSGLISGGSGWKTRST